MRKPREDGYFDRFGSYRIVKQHAEQPTGHLLWNTRAMMAYGIGALLCAAAYGVALVIFAH
jgi:hypothetical protein